ncbi:MAG: phosphotransferase family protein [Acidimicrobiia bacterium]|nr:phosphotransferase family protein [Acidimicrobiia bacterium]
MTNDTRAVRESEALNWGALTAYLRDALLKQDAFLARYGPTALRGDIVVEQFGGGHSNLTYLLRFGDVGLVLRRPPLGPVPPRAHDMAREFHWLSALHPRFPLAPQPFVLCEDTAVVGAVFYVMERRRGMVIRHEEPVGVAGQEAVRAGISGSLVDTLATLHAVEAGAPPLSSLGRPAGFMTRQVQGWGDRWSLAQTDEVPEMETVAAWLRARIPPDPERPAVVHGDFKLDNVILDPLDPAKVVGVLDWEMCALGDPLVDVGIFLSYWIRTPGDHGSSIHDALSTVTDRPGWFSREAVLERYVATSGRDLRGIGFYETFAVFKLAVVLQQIYVRYVRGQTDDPRFATLGARVLALARRAADLTTRHG